ncbi:MAG: glycoside hydrolase family 2 [Xanthomonadales bacterium]|nr:glycoside hydrolase family 2 [Xanthomonadales bacterium]
MGFLRLLGAVLVLALPAPSVHATPGPGGAEIMLGQAEAPMNGPWKFRLGDDPRWASPQWDDRGWETVDLTPAPGAHDPDVGLPGYVPGWMKRGHLDAYGYAWYRLHVRWHTPEASQLVIVGPTYVEDAYEVYWNGKRLGGVGDFSKGTPRAIATRPALLRVPVRGASGEAVVAIRVYLAPGMPRSGDAGGIHIAPILAEKTAGEARYVAQWAMTFVGYVVDAVEPFLFVLLGLYALSVGRFSPADRFHVALAVALVLTAALRANQVLFNWGGFEDLRQYTIAKYAILEPAIFLAWAHVWDRWTPHTAKLMTRLALVLAILMAVAGLVGEAAAPLRLATRLGFLIPLGSAAFRILREGSMCPLALSALLLVCIGLFAEELSLIGIQGIWFPFGVGVSRTQYAYALLIPALALACHIRSRPRSTDRLVE